MSSIDERVVEMKFDNAQFEAGVKQTLSSLEGLKNSVDSLDQGANLTNIAKNVKYMSEQFSPLGIIGIKVLQNLTDAAMGFGSAILSKAIAPLKQFGSAIKNYVINPLTGGGLQTVLEGGFARASTIEQAEFMINGLAKDTGETWKKLNDDISYAVNDTAYGFDEAASAAASFMATGIEAGDQMKTSLRAISGTAAMTGASYSDIAKVFTTVAGNGRLMGDQLLQLSSRGINIAAILSQQMGKSESEIRGMVSKGKIDFGTFAKAMDDAFGEHAKDANKTFSGATANIRAALKKIGADFASVMISTDDYNKSLETGSYNLINIANNVRKFINGIKSAIEGVNVYDELKNTIGPLDNFTNTFHTVAQGITSAFDSAFEQVRIDVDGATGDATVYKLDKLGNVIDTIHRKANNKELEKAANNGGRYMATITQLVPPLQNAFDNLYGAIQNVTKFVVGVADSVNAAWKKIFGNDLFGTIEKVTGAIKDVTDKLPKVDSVSDTLASMFGIEIPKAADTAAKALTKESKSIDKTSQSASSSQKFFANLRDTMTGLFAAVDIVRKVMGYVGQVISKVVIPVVGGLIEIILSITGTMGAWFGEIDKNVPSVEDFGQKLDGVLGILKPFTDVLSGAKDALVDFFMALRPGGDPLGSLKNTLDKASTSVYNFFNGIKLSNGSSIAQDVQRRFEPVMKFLQTVGDKLKPILDSIVGAIKGFVGKITDSAKLPENPIAAIYEIITGSFDKLVSFISGIKMPPFMDKIKDEFDTVKGSDIIKTFLDVLKDGWDGVTDFFSNLEIPEGDTFLDKVKNFFEPVKDFFTDLPGAFAELVSNIFGKKDLNSTVASSLGGNNITQTAKNSLNPLGDFLNKVGGTIADGLNTIIGAFDNFASRLDLDYGTIKGVVFDFISVIGAIKVVQILNSVNKISEGIGGIIGAFQGLAKGGVLGILGLSGPIKAFTATLESMQQSVKADNVTKIAAAIAILVGSLILMGSVDPNVLIQGGIALGALAAGLMVMTKKMNGNNLIKLGAGMKALAVSMILVAIACLAFQTVDWPTIGKAAVVFGVLIFALAGATAIMGGANVSGINKIAFTLTAFAAGIYILAKAVEVFIGTKPEELKRSVSAVADLMIMMSVTMAVLNETSKGAKSSALNVLAVAASIAILAGLVKMFSGMDVGSVVQGMIFVGILMGSIVGMTALMSKAGAEATKAVPALLTLVGAIAALSFIVLMFSEIPIKDLGTGLAVVGGAAALLALDLYMLSLLGPEVNKAIPAIAAITIAIGVLSAAVYAMGTMMTGDQATQGIIALAAVMAILGGALLGISAVIGFVPQIAIGLEALSTACLAIGGGVALAGIGIAALAWGISTLIDSVNPQAMQNVVDSLKVLSQLDWQSFLSLAGVSVSLVLLGVGFLALAGGIALLSNYVDSIPTIMNSISSMSQMLGSIDAGNFALLGIAMIGVGLGAAVMGAGLLVLAAGVAVISAVDLAGTMQNLVDVFTNLASTMTVEQALMLAGVGSGALVLGLGLLILAGGIAALGATNPLAVFTAVVTGANLLTSIDGVALAGIALSLAFLGVTSLVAGAGLAALGGGLSIIGGNLATLMVIDSFDAGQMALVGASFLALGAGSLIAGAGLLVLGAGAAVLQNGLASLIILSTMDPAKTAELGAAFLALGVGSVVAGPGLLILGVGAAVAAPALQSLAISLMLLQVALGAVGSMISGAVSSIASGVSSLVSSMKEVGGDLINGLIQGIKDSPLGGIVDWLNTNLLEPIKNFFGVHSPSTVFDEIGGNLIEGLSNGIKDFDILGTIQSVGEGILSAFTDLDLPGKLKDVGGDIMTNLTGGLSDFAKDPIGTIKGIGDSIGSSIGDIAKNMSPKGSDISKNLGSGISSGSKNVTSSMKDINTGSLREISGNLGKYLGAGKNMSMNVGSGITGAASNVSNAAKSISSGGVSAISTFDSKFGSQGRTLGSNLGTGLRGMSGHVSSASRSLGTGAASAVRGTAGSFGGAGRNMASGLAAGIRSGASSAISAARSLATRALNAAKHALGIKSPSREFAKVGMYSDLGFAKGVTRYSNRVTDSVKQMAKQSIKSLGSNMGMVPNLILGVDTNDPVIKPSLDLSNVMQQSKLIDGIFNSQYALGLSGSIGSISDYNTARKFDMQNQNQNATTNTRNNVYNITLDYKAGEDANKIVNDIAAAIKSRSRMEVR